MAEVLSLSLESDGKRLEINLNAGDSGYVLGPVGSGKTRLLRSIAMVRTSPKVKLRLFERETQGLSQIERDRLRYRVAYVHRQSTPLAYLSLYDNLALPLRIQGFKESRVALYCQQLLAWLKLNLPATAPAVYLSNGESQLLVLAQAIIRQPDLLILDDPFTSLGEQDRERIYFLLKELSALGMTRLISSHQREIDEQHVINLK